jgi:hypothetical protein
VDEKPVKSIAEKPIRERSNNGKNSTWTDSRAGSQIDPTTARRAPKRINDVLSDNAKQNQWGGIGKPDTGDDFDGLATSRGARKLPTASAML